MPVGVELATGVAASLIFESLKRPFDTIVSEIRRRERVTRALSDRTITKLPGDTALVEKASEDLARIIGAGTGKLTVPVSLFISELKRTAIPESIASAIFCGGDPSALRTPFELFYARFNDLPFSSDQLFDAFCEACRARIDQVKDPELLEIVRAQHRDLTSRIDAISRAMGDGIRETQTYSNDELRDARLRIARAIDAENRYVSVETLQGAKKFTLSSLAIPARISPIDVRTADSATVETNGETITYLTFRRQFDRAVILGDPGGGKSTLTQMVLAKQASQIILEASNPQRNDFEQRDLRIPLRVILRRYEARAERTPSYNFFDHIKDDLRVALEGDDKLATKYLSAALALGEAIIIFDGLDEILDVGTRRRIVDQIEQFSQIYSCCPILVTSRLVGYRDAPLSDEFTTFGLSRFNEAEITKYSEKAIAAVGRVKASEAKIKADEFMAQTSKVGRDIRQNPLMLGLMVQIFVYRGDVPDNRPEVYRECATLMFEKWDGRREIEADVPRQEIELLDVFGYVASRTFGDATSEEGVSRDWLVKELRQHFEDWYVDKASANRAANSLVTFLTGRAWVMSEVGPGVFKFTHRTFLEYFFARNLISESRGLDELLSIHLIPRVIENQWSVISHLALHMAVFRDGGKSRQAAHTLNEALTKTIYTGSQELAFLNFVGTALGYLVIPENMYLEIVEKCVRRAVILGSSYDVSILTLLDSLASGTNQRRQLVNQAIEAEISGWLVGPYCPELVFSMYVIGMQGSAVRHETRRRIPQPENPLWHHLRPQREGAKSYIFELAKVHVDVARAYIYVYGERRFELFNIHGPDLLRSHRNPLVPEDVTKIMPDAVDILIGVTERNAPDPLIIDCERLINAVAKDICGNNIQLSALIGQSDLQDGYVETLFEGAFFRIWQKFRQRGRPKQMDHTTAECLVCILSGSEITENATHPSLRRVRSPFLNLIAPYHIIEEVAKSVTDPDIRNWLEPWLAQQLEKRKAVSDSSTASADV